MKNKAFQLSALGLACALSGCQAYTERHDGVTTYAGDSLPINEAKMVEDPWKRRAYNDHLHGDGQRLGDAVQRYKTANSEDSGNGAQPIVLAPAPGSETN